MKSGKTIIYRNRFVVVGGYRKIVETDHALPIRIDNVRLGHYPFIQISESGGTYRAGIKLKDNVVAQSISTDDIGGTAFESEIGM